jgi:hypothetical protein
MTKNLGGGGIITSLQLENIGYRVAIGSLQQHKT